MAAPARQLFGEISDLRSAFPALQRREGGHPVAYFDGPGGTQVPAAVADAIGDYLLHHNANTHWQYPTSRETDAALAAARRALGDFLGAAPSEVAFGLNMTTLTFHLARGLARQWAPGDRIVVTELDHQANVAPWVAAARDFGLTVRTVRIDPEHGRLDWDDLAAALAERPRLLAIGAASNALGTITDVAAAAELAHRAGTLVFVDAVHYAPHRLVDVAALGCDFLACSAYKFYGPHIGILYGRESLLGDVPVPKLAPAPDTAPERIETGTQNHEGIVGAAAAVDFLAGLGGSPEAPRRDRLVTVFRQLHDRGEALFARLWEGLNEIAGATLYGPPPGQPRTPTIAFTVAGHPAAEVAAHLARAGVFVSDGDFYASEVVRRLGLQREGLVRAGCACYTTPDEIDRLVAGVRDLVGR